MIDDRLETACTAAGITDGQRQAREFVVASRNLEAAKDRYHRAFTELRTSNLDDACCVLIAEALKDLGVDPVGDYVVVMNEQALSIFAETDSAILPSTTSPP